MKTETHGHEVHELIDAIGVKKTVKETGILFKGAMVRAILEGRKTQTRRIIKSPKDDEDGLGACPYGQPGDRLWVKETWYDSRRESKRHPITYRADISADEDLSRDFKWKPSIFMPRWASRITLEITGVRVERLQDISDEDAIAEGCAVDDSVYDYERLFESINGKGSWAKNPWVWVISFKRL